MNSGLAHLQPYPFEKLNQLLRGQIPDPKLEPIDFSIGEPKHPSPAFVWTVATEHLSGLSRYPKIAGTSTLREAIANWLQKRFALSKRPDPIKQILTLNGSREGLFSIAQCLLRSGSNDLVLMPNPFYQIYEGAALLAGAKPVYLPIDTSAGHTPNLDQVSEETWRSTKLLYLCSPGNPTGGVLTEQQLRQAIELANKYNFVIASDECYSELYFDETRPPPGLLQACENAGLTDFRNCLVFHSLSKRSNLPGLRSGFVAGDEKLIATFLRYRTYHGCAMSEQFQAISTAAWQDEDHVVENRAHYRKKFIRADKILSEVLPLRIPPASFYLWLPTPGADEVFCQRLYAEQNLKVVPGSFLGRQIDGHNPGEGYVRIALVAEAEQCAEGINRIRDLLKHY